MKKSAWVISVGGSCIVPDEVDYKFINNFENFLNKNKSIKFVIVTGGGSTARKYISALRNLKQKTKSQCLTGIAITRFHAGFLARLFGKKANEIIPENMNKVKSLLAKNQVVFCGGLRYGEKKTSDGTAADIAGYLNCPFINLTNVKGIYDKNPKKHKNAKFIKDISWKRFYELARQIEFKAGQHFVLDQNAARTAMIYKIPTYIVGSLKDIENIIKEKKYQGSLISG